MSGRLGFVAVGLLIAVLSSPVFAVETMTRDDDRDSGGVDPQGAPVERRLAALQSATASRKIDLRDVLQHARQERSNRSAHLSAGWPVDTRAGASTETGVLRIIAERSAEVFVDGEKRQGTPVAVELPLGRHEVTIRFPGLAPRTRVVQLGRRETRELFFYVVKGLRSAPINRAAVSSAPLGPRRRAW